MSIQDILTKSTQQMEETWKKHNKKPHFNTRHINKNNNNKTTNRRNKMKLK